MEKSADEVTVMEVRTVRRKLTQSTLFPHKAQDSSAEKVIQVRREEDISDDEDVEWCGSQGRKKRKAKGKATPQSKPAKKKISTKAQRCLNGMIGSQDSPVPCDMKTPRKPREKKQTNTTPKRARANSLAEPGFTVTSTSPLPSEKKTKCIPDLRLEAKRSAEEDSRIFAGKQVHPFFSSRKSSKVTQGTTDAEASSCARDKNNSSQSLGPIHVFDSAQDGTPALDWSRWAFSERSFFSRNHVDEMTYFVDPGSLKEFTNYLKVSCTSSTSFSANGVSGGHLVGNSPVNPILTDENVEHEIGRTGVCSNHAGDSEYCSDEKKSSITRFRNQGFNCWNKDVLWTKKYQPERATEVCGNSESVKYLSEWLHTWHAKALQCSESANGGPKNTSENSDHDDYESDCDSEKLSQGVKLKNVLLVTGPTGSGKSASIYACAREQGFNVIEVNTSDWRNGALVKQKFGEAVESHSVKRMNENKATPKEHESDSINHHIMSQEADSEVVELTTVAIGDGTYSSVDMSAKVPCSRSKLPRDRVQLKTLVLFEDVDISFTEDRGFINAIQHLAKTAKLPIILTTNSTQCFLPDSLDREEIYFLRPSLKDLLGCAVEICTSEKANIEPSLIPCFIEFFHGDIRKTIMHLQFWCQSTACIKDKKMQENYGPQVLDLEVAHQLLMKLIPWGFASELSELIEFELNKTLTLQEEYSAVMEVNEEKHLCEMRRHGFPMYLNEDCMAAKKDAMLKRNSYHDYDPFEAELETQDLSNSSGSPITFSRRNNHRRNDYVLSLSGDDDMPGYECPVISTPEETVAEYNVDFDSGFLSCSPKPPENVCQSILEGSSPNTLDKISPFESGENFECHIHVSENISQIHDSCGVVDMSCVPESSFVPETRIDDEQEESCRSVSYVPSMIAIISSGNKLQENPITVEVECHDERLSRLHIDSQNMLNSYNINVEPIHYEDVGDSHTAQMEVSTRRWQLMDECSQMNFNRCDPIQLNALCKKTGFIQEAWNRLRESHQDLGQYVTSKQKYASQFLKVTSGASNLISDADILLSDFRLGKNDSAEPSTIPHDESDVFQWYNEQLHMTSTFSDHGLSLYAKDVIAAVSNMDQTCLVDSAQELLTNSTDMIMLQKAVAQGAGIHKLCPQETSDSGLVGLDALPEREAISSCQDIIMSIVPPRSYMNVRGEALHEYRSSMNNISRSETSRLSAGVDRTKRRRRRLSEHYLSSGKLSLSQEDISILDQCPFRPHQGDS
ncbi:unnamed protein product [Rhodiola kirilowii]